MRRFEVSFNQPKARFSAVAVRDVKAQHIGKLVSVKGLLNRFKFSKKYKNISPVNYMKNQKIIL